MGPSLPAPFHPALPLPSSLSHPPLFPPAVLAVSFPLHLPRSLSLSRSPSPSLPSSPYLPQSTLTRAPPPAPSQPSAAAPPRPGPPPPRRPIGPNTRPSPLGPALRSARNGAEPRGWPESWRRRGRGGGRGCPQRPEKRAPPSRAPIPPRGVSCRVGTSEGKGTRAYREARWGRGGDSGDGGGSREGL